jgi:hypothetical protein
VERRGLMRDASRVLLGAVLAVVLIGGGWFGWKAFHTHYVVETNDDGAAVAQVISIAFHDAKTLKVRSATGIVQSTATDARWGGMLTSSRVIKAPFSVDYFLDLSKFSAKDLRWDPNARTLTVRVPEIRVGDVNIDESKPILVETGGVFVTRSAGEVLTKRASGRAHGLAQKEAEKPEYLRQAREIGRRQVASLMAAPLEAAHLEVKGVRVLYPDEPDQPIPFVPMDHSRSVNEVLGLSR